jgi:hypothetical protein
VAEFGAPDDFGGGPGGGMSLDMSEGISMKAPFMLPV